MTPKYAVQLQNCFGSWVTVFRAHTRQQALDHANGLSVSPIRVITLPALRREKLGRLETEARHD